MGIATPRQKDCECGDLNVLYLFHAIGFPKRYNKQKKLLYSFGLITSTEKASFIQGYAQYCFYIHFKCFGMFIKPFVQSFE